MLLVSVKFSEGYYDSYFCVCVLKIYYHCCFYLIYFIQNLHLRLKYITSAANDTVVPKIRCYFSQNQLLMTLRSSSRIFSASLAAQMCQRAPGFSFASYTLLFVISSTSPSSMVVMTSGEPNVNNKAHTYRIPKGHQHGLKDRKTQQWFLLCGLIIFKLCLFSFKHYFNICLSFIQVC